MSDTTTATKRRSRKNKAPPTSKRARKKPTTVVVDVAEPSTPIDTPPPNSETKAPDSELKATNKIVMDPRSRVVETGRDANHVPYAVFESRDTKKRATVQFTEQALAHVRDHSAIRLQELMCAAMAQAKLMAYARSLKLSRADLAAAYRENESEDEVE